MYDVVEHRRTIGDRRTPIGATISDSNDNPISLSGLSVTFLLTKDVDGDILINYANATVVSASAGTVQYTLTADDITAIGTSPIVCWGWFRVSNGSTSDHHPVGRRFRIEFEEAL